MKKMETKSKKRKIKECVDVAHEKQQVIEKNLQKTGTAIFNFYKTHEGAEHRNPNGVFLIAFNYQPIIQ